MRMRIMNNNAEMGVSMNERATAGNKTATIISNNNSINNLQLRIALVYFQGK